ncbi:hypothetical protein VM1G_04438 [Cytospora mali]|uniref:Uncharacterized protein n=1 Tax=Cytospora mali TaxID=578113 RepID=A0A194VW90_CYTMA|nr:hypothetical protein VM1G_04438 [Valsa mali]
MRGLLKAGVLLAPALAAAVALEEDTIASALITLYLPESGDSITSQDLVFSFDIQESNDACGYGNVTIDGQDLPEGGSGSLIINEDRVVDASWNFTCVTWNGKPQEQLLSMNVDYVNGQPIENVGFTLRFQQVAPVWISDIEGDASMTRLHSLRQDDSKHHCNDDNNNNEIDLDAAMAELNYLRWQMTELSHTIRAREQRLAEAFGWNKHINECDSLKCVIGTVVHKMKGAAKSIYGGEGHPGPHGPRPEPHFPQHHGHGNHSEDGEHPPPPPPPHGGPGFHHPPPFCKCAPPPPPHGGHHPPPEGSGPQPPPHGEHPPPPPKGDAHPPHEGFDGPPPPPPHGEHPPPPPPMSPHHEGPGFFGSLFGFIHPHHRPSPPPMPWEHNEWEPTSGMGHGHGHGHEGGPMHHEGPGGEHRGKPYHEGHQQFDELERPHNHEGKPHHQDHEDHESSAVSIEAEKQDKEEISEVEPKTQPEEHEAPSAPLDRPANDKPWESELRRDDEHDPPHGPPPHDGPHGRPHDGPGAHGPPPPPPPRPHGPPPRGPIFIHIASAVASFFLLARCIRKSIRTPRRHRGSPDTPWYKKMCFGPHYYELSEDEEKEAMLQGSDEDSDDEDGDANVVTRDISQFRTAAEVVSEMVAVEDARMMAHSRQPSPVMPAPVAAAPTAQHMQAYVPAHVMHSNAIPMPMSTAPMTVDPATMAAMAAMFPDLHHEHDEMVEELPAYQEADRGSESDDDELASSMVSDGYRPGCSGAPYTPSESGSQGASDILGDTKN